MILEPISQIIKKNWLKLEEKRLLSLASPGLKKYYFAFKSLVYLRRREKRKFYYYSFTFLPRILIQNFLCKKGFKISFRTITRFNRQLLDLGLIKRISWYYRGRDNYLKRGSAFQLWSDFLPIIK